MSLLPSGIGRGPNLMLNQTNRFLLGKVDRHVQRVNPNLPANPKLYPAVGSQAAMHSDANRLLWKKSCLRMQGG